MSYYEDVRRELIEQLNEIKKTENSVSEKLELLKSTSKKVEKQKQELNQIVKERQQGYPTLAKAINKYMAIQDRKVIDFLLFKSQPAIQASEYVKEYSKLRREADKKRRIAESLVEYYESICPFLVDLKEELWDPKDETYIDLADYSEEELQDEVTNYISKEEYRKLSAVERNQLALDRYWKRHKSKLEIGRVYERYVGYLYEEEGYDVNYQGILKGYEDLGRDVIATKGDIVKIVQCKYWSQFKTIYEKHIFQFFGTVFQYKDTYQNSKVEGLFYTSTQLSNLAKRFAQELGITIKEEFKMPILYPCIKCNIGGNNKEKIYHLPFDQQYDKVKVELKKGEKYCTTTNEAEEMGFRRAFRYSGLTKKK